jgi:serine/threonine-protein kinase HipA
MSLTSNRKIYVGLDLQITRDPIAVGMLKLDRRGVVESAEFAYGKRYLENSLAYALNPDYLPLKVTSFVFPEKRLRDGGAIPLSFRDALPDAWGRKMLEAKYGKNLDDIDVLLLTNADRIGAMVFTKELPIPPSILEVDLMQLDQMAQAVKRLELSMEVTPEMRRLLLCGGSLGGARPKATFISENRRWLAKFPAQGDDHDVELLEKSTLDVAARCGIDVSPSRLENIYRGHALLTLRFDRDGLINQEQRIHYLSASALLNTPYESSDGSYIELAQVLRRISSRPAHDLDQLFRRMVFNLLIDNTDDHVKNHGVLYAGNGLYKLSPAFDVVMQLTNIGYQEMAIKPSNHNSRMDLALEVAPHFGMSLEAGQVIVESMITIIDECFISIVLQQGGNEQLVKRVGNCLKRQREIIMSN